MEDLPLPFDDLTPKPRVALRMVSHHVAGDDPHSGCGSSCNRRVAVYEQQELGVGEPPAESFLSEIA